MKLRNVILACVLGLSASMLASSRYPTTLDRCVLVKKCQLIDRVIATTASATFAWGTAELSMPPNTVPYQHYVIAAGACVVGLTVRNLMLYHHTWEKVHGTHRVTKKFNVGNALSRFDYEASQKVKKDHPLLSRLFGVACDEKK